MRTVDYRYEDEPLWEEPDDAHRRSVLTCEELVSSDDNPCDDDAPPAFGVGTSVEGIGGSSVALSSAASDSGMSLKLAALINDILAAMRRRYRAAQTFFDAK
ncbi:hypothetical protein ACG7TL_002847 [Trametes sanguinea]